MRKKDKILLQAGVTSQQLATIQAIHKEIRHYQQFINRPQSVLINMIVFPVLINFLFVRPEGWLHGIYIQLADLFALSRFIKSARIINSSAKELKKAGEFIHTSYKGLSVNILANCEVLGFSDNIPVSAINPCATYLDMLFNFGFLDPTIKEYLTAEIRIIQQHITTWDAGLLRNPKLMSILKELQKVNPNTITFSIFITLIQQLMNFTTDEATNFLKQLPKSSHVNQFLVPHAMKYGFSKANLMSKFMTIVLGILGQKYITDRLLLKYSLKTPCLDYNQSMYTAEQTISVLKNQRQALVQKATTYKTFARYFVVSAFFFVLYNLFSNPAATSPGLMMACLAIISTAMKDGSQDFYQWRQSLRHQHFLIFKLKPEHVPAEYPYEELKCKVLEGRAGAHGQGWKFISGHLATDLTTGKSKVPMSAKYRIFGRYSDTRLYAYSVKSNPYVLHRIVGLETHAHTR